MGFTVIIGGASSGKSAFAEELGRSSGLKIVYLATARIGDLEMSEKIARHRRMRPPDWQTIEEPIKLAKSIVKHSTPDSLLLIECATLWLNNLIMDGQNIEQAIGKLVAEISNAEGEIIMVTNEIGLGIVALNDDVRRFISLHGRLNQRLTNIANRVFLISAGIPVQIKAATPTNNFKKART